MPGLGAAQQRGGRGRTVRCILADLRFCSIAGRTLVFSRKSVIIDASIASLLSFLNRRNKRDMVYAVPPVQELFSNQGLDCYFMIDRTI